jgi:hypothetical protein
MKFRKKPIIIEAEQYFPDRKIEGVIIESSRMPYIRTLEGDMDVRMGDWVITGVNGEKYPCKPDIFEKTYEKVE